MTGSLSTTDRVVDGTVIEPEPDCVFCPGNGKVDIVCDLGSMYLVRAKDLATMQDLTDRWLIIPSAHVTDMSELPKGWGETLVQLVLETGLTTGLNLNLNLGPRAGQTEPHLHWWVLDRSTDELGKGMGWMISEVLRLYRVNRELAAENQRLRQLLSGPRDRDATLA